MDSICENVDEYNPSKKLEILIVFDAMIADITSNKKPNSIVTELFIEGIKLNISLVFVTPCYFTVLKNIRVNSSRYFIMKTPNKSQIQQITFHYSSDIGLEDYMNLYQKCTANPYFFIVIDTTIASDNLLHSRNNLLERI